MDVLMNISNDYSVRNVAFADRDLQPLSTFAERLQFSVATSIACGEKICLCPRQVVHARKFGHAFGVRLDSPTLHTAFHVGALDGLIMCSCQEMRLIVKGLTLAGDQVR